MARNVHHIKSRCMVNKSALTPCGISSLNPLTLISDQDRTSPYYHIWQTSDENKENVSIRGILVDPISNLQTNIIVLPLSPSVWAAARKIIWLGREPNNFSFSPT